MMVKTLNKKARKKLQVQTTLEIVTERWSENESKIFEMLDRKKFNHFWNAISYLSRGQNCYLSNYNCQATG